ncbi:MAG TPA: hypothetical protein VNV42_04275 [Solirubrobacteraceae bacterium]|jgi:hypothetical protein|nr:hypothetical protein [Solirubrobacteraceae bacterium]
MSVAAAIGALPASATAGAASATGLPAVDETRAPAYVREGSTTVKQDYSTAVGFEEMLLNQLSQSLAQSSGLGGEGAQEGGEEEGGAGGGSSQSGLAAGGEGGGMVGALLPQTLAESLTRDGGLGLATQLMHALDPAAASAPQSGAHAGGASA